VKVLSPEIVSSRWLTWYREKENSILKSDNKCEDLRARRGQRPLHDTTRN